MHAYARVCTIPTSRLRAYARVCKRIRADAPYPRAVYARMHAHARACTISTSRLRAYARVCTISASHLDAYALSERLADERGRPGSAARAPQARRVMEQPRWRKTPIPFVRARPGLERPSVRHARVARVARLSAHAHTLASKVS